MELVLENISREIFRELGPGHRECVYHRALEIELRNASIPYECEVVVPLFYKGEFLSHIRLDLVVAKKTIVELKANKSLREEDTQQITRYMTATGIPRGFLVNFGGGSDIEFKKFLPPS